MKEVEELDCPYNARIVCIDSEYYRIHKATRPLEKRNCNKCCWGPNGESIMAARLHDLTNPKKGEPDVFRIRYVPVKT